MTKGGKVMEIYCSRCGNHERILRSVRGAKAKSKKGWRSFGSVIYCPECTRTWKERNDKELNTVEETNEWIYERLVDE